MLTFLNSLAEKWANWCGDRDMENAIRQHLTQNGCYGGSAKLRNVRLIAVQRPGWLQVFRFEATARLQAPPSDGPDPDAEYKQLYGLVREDARKSMTKVRVFRDPHERQKLFEEWGEDLLQLRGAQGLGRR